MKVKKLYLYLIFLLLFFVSSSNALTPENALTPDEIFKKYADSVVYVYSKYTDKLQASGTGFFVKIRNNIYVLTNDHVIHSDENRIKLKNGKEIQIEKIVARDARADMALLLLKGNTNGLVPLTVAEKLPNIGQQITVIGMPNNTNHTLSTGKLTGTEKGFRILLEKEAGETSETFKIADVVQFSAPFISQGSSGSPIFNEAGNVIGIVTSIPTEATERKNNTGFGTDQAEMLKFLQKMPMITLNDLKNSQRKINEATIASANWKIASNGEIIFKDKNCIENKAFLIIKEAKVKLSPPGITVVFRKGASLEYKHTEDDYDYYPVNDISMVKFEGDKSLFKYDNIGVCIDKKQEVYWFVDDIAKNFIGKTKVGDNDFLIFSPNLYISSNKSSIAIQYLGIERDNALIKLFVFENGQQNSSVEKLPIDNSVKKIKIESGTLEYRKTNKNMFEYRWTTVPIL